MPSGDPKRILPLVAHAFADLGYRRATTAALAKRCKVRENVLYRLWPSKKEMFLAAIDYIWQNAMDVWLQLLAKPAPSRFHAAQAVLEYESQHHGETGLYKLLFAALTEAHDPDINAALQKMYNAFHRFIAQRVGLIRQESTLPKSTSLPSDDLTAWGLLGLSMISNIAAELKLLPTKNRGQLFTHLAPLLILPNTTRNPI